jgi:hypothetical protein
MACYQSLLETKTLKRSNMYFYVIKTSSDLNCDQLVTLLREFEVAVNRAGGELVFVG